LKEWKEGISFFIPCLNEEKNIVKTLNEIKGAVDKVNIDYEILVFDDNSKDKTVENIKNFAESNPNILITLILNQITLGLGSNYVDGSYLAKYKYYVCIFGGNSEPKETIELLFSKLGKFDMIIPYFSQGNRTFLRRNLSRAYTFLVNIISGHSIKYYNWSIVHLTKNVMRWHSDSFGFAYQAEIVTKLLNRGASYIQLEAENCDRNDGKSNALNFKNLASVTHSLTQIFLRRLRSFIFKG